jgi:hypothetical protein
MTENHEPQAYPLNIRGDLSSPPNRGLWLIKWILAIPHFIVLFFLSIASFVVWFIAWWAILFTARYPRGMFNFNVGVMRWTWRVSFYAGVLGTDRYPPFSLASDDDYPADLSVEYPERLSRIKVIFKWWLLAIPHYIIVYFFGGLGFAVSIIAGVALLFTGRYIEGLFGVQMALNRWNWRVSGYAGLLYDDYPPFEFDTSSG